MKETAGTRRIEKREKIEREREREREGTKHSMCHFLYNNEAQARYILNRKRWKFTHRQNEWGKTRRDTF